MRKSILLSLLCLAAVCGEIFARGPLAEGRWAKVGVDTTGIFEISYEHLRELGFREPERVSVYGSGGVVAADNSFAGPFGSGFAPAPAMHTADGRLLFFAEGPVRAEMKTNSRLTLSRNFYDTHSYYYLSDMEGARVLPKIEYEPGAKPARTSHNHILFYDRQMVSPAKGGAVMLSTKLRAGQTETYPISLADYDYSASASAKLYCEYGIKISRRESLPMTISGGLLLEDIVAPKALAGTNPAEAYARSYISATLRPSESSEDGVLCFESKTEEVTSFSAVDFIYIIYPRRNTLGKASELVMNYLEAPGAVEFHDVPSDVEVWIIDPGAPSFRLGASASSSGRMVFGTSDALRIVAFSPSSEHHRVCSAEPVANQDFTSSATPDILIIAAPSLMDEAEELAGIHRCHQGFDVLVVPQDKVFDEFSEGSRTPMAFRRLAKTLYDKAPDKLRHVILYGSGSYDNIRIDNKGSRLVTFQAETTEESRWTSYNYCGDQYFGMLSDDYDHSRVIYEPMLVNVGRVAASSSAGASAYNAKVRRFFERGPQPSAFLRAVMYSDLGDDYRHFDQNDEACGVLAESGLMTVARLDKCFYPESGRYLWPTLRTTAGAALTRGAGFIGFSGHGGAYDMGRVIDRESADLYRYDIAPFGMFASCETFAFDRGGFGICNHMLEKEHGGILCAMAAARSVVLNYNRRLETEVARTYVGLKPGASYGDLLRISRNRILAGNATMAICRNVMCYNFGGDPALPVPVAEFGVFLEDDDDTVFTPLQSKTLRGYIADADGNLVEDFDGTVEIALHRSAMTRISNDSIKTASDNHDILCNVSAKLVGGRFCATVTVPESSEGRGTNRISMAAVDLSGRCAAGYDMSYSVSAESAPGAAIDMTPPEILSAYVESGEFGSACFFHAVVDPSPSGLRCTSGLEHSVNLSVDGRASVPSAGAAGRIDSDGLVHFDIPFSTVSAGKHTMSFEVVNNVGIKDSTKVDFIVGMRSSTAVLRHNLGERTVAREDIEFTIDSASTKAHLLIVDRGGRTVLSVPSCSFPFRWNLTLGDGSRVPDGPYRAWVMLDDGNATGSTEAIHFTVLRPCGGNK